MSTTPAAPDRKSRRTAVATASGRVASLARWRGAEAQETRDARRDLAAERIAQYVADIVSKAPPLTENQAAKIAALLRTESPPPAVDTPVSDVIAEHGGDVNSVSTESAQ